MLKYSEKVKDHLMNPRNVGTIENPSGVGSVGNPVCGDIMEMYLKVEEGIIVDAKFRTFGCGAAIATSSMVTELAKGKTIEEAMGITKDVLINELDGLPPVKTHCSVLGIDALQKAIMDFKAKKSA
ncbi:MAG TPA: iron-sulfur cluster assembly scaffold protein [Candidatus Andersenbacteria bacterium]|nr:MAG: Nitrogen-fixing nifu-like protein [Parcubacteria group bacterium GW2011_GWA2_45_14]OGY35450.1 MAG: iron-sulfur cluster assembly scaffold protein [Candidatus Andersenbacteria bacterium RIFCSPHIGHO2_02_FULL_46_16]OGY37653.1 MAG: iron-sulfur cluster assembly scaffold protein [Candidatus Andersenbacteria bacterium RIFCSPLOWO2_02_FULL_46_11]HBE90674.1 iron-sulfur cluster assembly scaffold protein [Candidatus Andersenbacteria bacterium]